MSRDAFNRFMKDQDRLVRSSDISASGLSRATFYDAVRREGWQRPFRRVAVPPHVIMDGYLATRAALASCGDEAVWVARASVLWLRELCDRPPQEVQLVIPYRRGRVRERGVRVTRSRTLVDDELTTIRGMPSTTLARAIRDLCSDNWSVEQLLPMCLAALQSRKLFLGDLRMQRARMGRGCTGVATMDTLIAEVEADGSDSILEKRGRAALRRESLPVWPHPRPFPWRAPDGVVDHLDIAFPREWVVIFCDGRAHHGTGAAFTKDRRAWNAVSGLWRPFWLDSWILRHDLDRFVATVTRELLDAPKDRRPATRERCRCSRCHTAR